MGAPHSKFKPTFGEMNQRQQAALGQSLKFAYHKLGECNWARNDLKTARMMFLKSCGLAPHVLKAVAYASLCAASVSFVSFLSSTKRESGS
jgi:hypothetical protein